MFSQDVMEVLSSHLPQLEKLTTAPVIGNFEKKKRKLKNEPYDS